MARIIRTDSANADFVSLVRQLDAYLRIVDGKDHAFYDQYNKIDKLKYVVLVYEDDLPAGCGAIKPYDKESMEIKRMFTSPEFRKRGVAEAVLKELEQWARALGYKRCILETGKKQVEAISLYRKNGYAEIPNFGQYAGVENSVCFGKFL